MVSMYRLVYIHIKSYNNQVIYAKVFLLIYMYILPGKWNKVKLYLKTKIIL